MASDGDLYRKRLIWGFPKAYKLACGGGSVEEEAAAVAAAMQKALRKDFRVGAFRSMVAVAVRTIAEHEAGLFADSSLEFGRMIGAKLGVVERRFAELPTTCEIKRIVESMAHEATPDARGATMSHFPNNAVCALRDG